MQVTLVVISGVKRGQQMPLRDNAELTFGRSLNVDHHIDDPFVSRIHFVVSVSDECVTLRDADSKPGTLVNGAMVKECQLQPGDVVHAGTTLLRLEASVAPEISTEDEDSTAHWLAQLPSTESEAYEHLWDVFFPRLVTWARAHLASGQRRAVDEEDIALTALDAFFRGVEAGQFVLADRDETWRLLIKIARCRVIDMKRYEMAEKRGGGRVLGESAIGGENAYPGIEQVLDPRSIGAEYTHLKLAVDELMQQLDDDVLRETAKLRLQGFSNREISARMHCSTSTTKNRLREVRKIWSHGCS